MKTGIILFSCLLFINNILRGQVPDSGLRIWLRADRGIMASGNNVIAWKDQSRNGIDAITATDSAPKLVAGQANGKPVVRFNGRNTGMQTKPFPTFPGKEGTIVLVARINDSSFTSGGGYGTFASTYFGKGITWQMGASPYVLYFYDGIGGSGFPYATITPKDWLLLTLARNKTTQIDFYRIDKYRTSFDIKDNQPDTNSLKIGYNGGLEVLNGDIAELIIYDRALSPHELSLVHRYLMGKYNIFWPRPPFYESWWFKTIMIVAGVTILILLTRFIAQRALKQKLAELERQSEIDRERLRISREMHDDIGAGLTRITLISEIAKHRSSNPSDLQQIAETSRQLVSSMSEIIWSLNPENRSLTQLLSYLREELNKLLEPSGMEYAIDLPETTGVYVLSNEQKRNILLITKEIVHNAVKHSKASRIHIAGKIKDDHLCITITDNGKGYDSHAPASGNGLRNLQHRFDQLKADFAIDTAPGNGVCSMYRIPLKSP